MHEEIAVRMLGTEEVPMLEKSVVEEVLVLHRLGFGSKQIAKRVELSRTTVRRYLAGATAGWQERPDARTLSPDEQKVAEGLWRGEASGNGVVVREMLGLQGIEVPLRTLQRYLQGFRAEELAKELATVRFETQPGQQLQIDFGERRVVIGGVLQTVYFFVATLGYSRRTFVRSGLSQRQDEWKIGLEEALLYFGGLVACVVVDNAKALILEHRGGVVRVHPAFEAFCNDRGLAVWACRPYRAQTKGKVESGVKYVKRNAIAGRSFESMAHLERHLQSWMWRADRRIHGTTHERPIDRFEAAERAAMAPLPERGLQVTSQRLRRQVANDCYVDLDTVRYSVPHRLARTAVDVERTATEVVVYQGVKEVARHLAGTVPFQWVTDPRHFKGLLRLEAAEAVPVESTLVHFGRSLEDYARVVGGEA
jgi:transposase